MQWGILTGSVLQIVLYALFGLPLVVVLDVAALIGLSVLACLLARPRPPAATSSFH